MFSLLIRLPVRPVAMTRRLRERRRLEWGRRAAAGDTAGGRQRAHDSGREKTPAGCKVRERRCAMFSMPTVLDLSCGELEANSGDCLSAIRPYITIWHSC